MIKLKLNKLLVILSNIKIFFNKFIFLFNLEFFKTISTVKFLLFSSSIRNATKSFIICVSIF